MTLASPIRWVQPSAESTAAPASARPGEWSELAAIERVSSEIELTARSQAFVGGLAARRPAGATLAPLHGGRSLDAPHGLVRGIARVVDGGRRDGPELVPAPPVRARRRGAAVADQSTVANAPSLATEQEADAEPASEPASAPTDVGLGAADLPEPRPRVVQAVTRFAVPGPREVTALTRAADGVPEPPAGRISRAPLVPDRSEAHVTEADTSAAVASATARHLERGAVAGLAALRVPSSTHSRTFGSAACSRRARARAVHPGPEPAGPTESDVVEASSVDSEPAGHLGTARAVAGHERRDGGSLARRAFRDVGRRGLERTDSRRRTAGAGRHLDARTLRGSLRDPSRRRRPRRSAGRRHAPARCRLAEAEMDATAVEAAAVTSRSGDAAGGTARRARLVRAEPRDGRPGGACATEPARLADRRRRSTHDTGAASLESGGGAAAGDGAARTRCGRGSRGGAREGRCGAGRATTRNTDRRAAARAHGVRGGRLPRGEEPTPAPVVDAPVAAPAPKAHADSGAQVAPARSTRSVLPGTPSRDHSRPAKSNAARARSGDAARTHCSRGTQRRARARDPRAGCRVTPSRTRNAITRRTLDSGRRPTAGSSAAARTRGTSTRPALGGGRRPAASDSAAATIPLLSRDRHARARHPRARRRVAGACSRATATDACVDCRHRPAARSGAAG